jgi:hypothetical protein
MMWQTSTVFGDQGGRRRGFDGEPQPLLRFATVHAAYELMKLLKLSFYTHSNGVCNKWKNLN